MTEGTDVRTHNRESLPGTRLWVAHSLESERHTATTTTKVWWLEKQVSEEKLLRAWRKRAKPGGEGASGVQLRSSEMFVERVMIDAKPVFLRNGLRATLGNPFSGIDVRRAISAAE